jgi:hypothetical protein
MKPGFFETPRHPAIDILDTRYKQVHNASIIGRHQ